MYVCPSGLGFRLVGLEGEGGSERRGERGSVVVIVVGTCRGKENDSPAMMGGRESLNVLRTGEPGNVVLIGDARAGKVEDRGSEPMLDV